MAVATESPTFVVTLHWPISDDQFAKLCALNPEMRFEYTSTGDLIIMSPTGGDTGHMNANLTTEVTLWSRQDGSGLIFDSSTLFVLPNGAKRSPDVSWIRRDRWEALSPEERRGFFTHLPRLRLGIEVAKRSASHAPGQDAGIPRQRGAPGMAHRSQRTRGVYLSAWRGGRAP